ncbi:DUF3850 domain-containing protein [Pseudomonas sp. NPDC087358]|uniref:DUF3850 domain-containing protein n=1 Tax=Pseudomonas sp. NPDC087358 TaxID=3364439 RepID=UPI00384F06B2
MAQYETAHELKVHRQPFEDLLSGVKTCEVRRCDDRNFSVGDLVWLRELRAGFGNPWSGRELRKRITHIQKDYGLPEHLCILSYAPAEDVRAVVEEPPGLREFAKEIITAAYDGVSYDGGDIQDIAVKHGLLRSERHTAPCGEHCACSEYGFPTVCLRRTELLNPAQ